MITTYTHTNTIQGNKKGVYIIIPTYNDNQVVKEVISKILDAGYANIILVDDGSTESFHFKSSNSPIYLLKHKTNLGQGAALQTGFEMAKKLSAEYVITFDADGQHDTLNLDILFNEILKEKVDVVLGSRFLSQKQSLPFIKLFILKIARFINFFFTGLLLSDAHNGLRILNKKALHHIHLSENRMAHATEFLFEIKKHHLKWKEAPVIIHYTSYSIKKGQRIGNSFKILIDLFLYKIFK